MGGKRGKLNVIVSIVLAIGLTSVLGGNPAGSLPGMDTDLGDSDASFWGERSDQRSSRFAGGDGSVSNPFQVSNVYELQNVSNNMSSHYVLVNDIDASMTAGWNGKRGFDPITAFNGSLDGQNFTVSNLTIDRSEDYVGLFGTIAQLGEVKNIGLVDVDVSGEQYVGALAGSNDNIVENCYSTGSVYGTNYTGGLVGRSDGNVTNCQASGSVSGSQQVGGLIGSLQTGLVEYCNATVDVSGSGWRYVGGLIGYMSAATVNYCHATGNADGHENVGGLVGATSSRLSDINYCYATGDVTGYVSNGGLMGRLEGGGIVQSFATGSVSGGNRIGGLVGYVVNGYIRDAYATGDVSGGYAGGLVGYINIAGIGNCYAVGHVTGRGGLIGWVTIGGPSASFWDIETSGTSNSAGGTGLNTVDMKKEETFTSAKWDFNSTWDIIEGKTYPYLKVHFKVHYKGPSLPPELDPMVEDAAYRSTIEPGFFQFPGADLDGTFNMTSDLDWLRLDPTGQFSGTPANNDVGIHWIEVTAEDLLSNSSTQNYTVEVINTNDPPSIITTLIPDATEDEPYSMALEVRDIDPAGDVLMWKITKSYAEFLELNVSTGELAGTPANKDVGERWIEIKVSDGNGGSDKVFLIFDVINVNDDPMIDTTDIVSATEDKFYENIYTGHDVDPTNDELVWSMETNAPSLSMDAATGRLSGTLTNDEVGERWVNVSLSDDKGGLTFTNFTLTVANVNDAPTITTTVLPEGTEDQPYEATVEAVDIDHPGDVLTWEILSTNADFLEIDPITGIISGSPDNEDVGEWTIELQVSDGNGGNTAADLTFKIVNVNDAPEITTENVETATQDEYYRVSYEGTDIDPTGDSLEWAVQTDAGFLTFHPTSGDLVGTPTNDDVGEWSVEVSVTDGRGGWAWSNFTLRVLNVNEAPYDALITASGDYIEGKDQQLNATASDPDIKHGDTLTFKWSSDISGDLGTGPSIVVSLSKGNHMITLTVTDSEGLSTTKSTVMEILEPKDDTSSSPGLTGIVAVAVIVMGAALRSRGLISNNLRNRKEEK